MDSRNTKDTLLQIQTLHHTHREESRLLFKTVALENSLRDRNKSERQAVCCRTRHVPRVKLHRHLWNLCCSSGCHNSVCETNFGWVLWIRKKNFLSCLTYESMTGPIDQRVVSYLLTYFVSHVVVWLVQTYVTVFHLLREYMTLHTTNPLHLTIVRTCTLNTH
jgi:hypothetical protein